MRSHISPDHLEPRFSLSNLKQKYRGASAKALDSLGQTRPGSLGAFETGRTLVTCSFKSSCPP